MEITRNDYIRLCEAVKTQGDMIVQLSAEVKALRSRLQNNRPVYAKPFRAWLLTRMGELELSQQAVAIYCDVTSGCVSHWATGYCLPRKSHFTKLCELLQADRIVIEKLCRGEEVIQQ